MKSFEINCQEVLWKCDSEILSCYYGSSFHVARIEILLTPCGMWNILNILKYDFISNVNKTNVNLAYSKK